MIFSVYIQKDSFFGANFFDESFCDGFLKGGFAKDNGKIERLYFDGNNETECLLKFKKYCEKNYEDISSLVKMRMFIDEVLRDLK